MPAKPKVTKEMIVDAAFEIARKEGMEISMQGQYQKS